MPSSAPVSTSVMDVPTIDETVSPVEVVSTSLMPVRGGVDADNPGASLTALMVTSTVLVEESVVPSLSL